jgi:hypothetical protein
VVVEKGMRAVWKEEDLLKAWDGVPVKNLPLLWE